MGTKDPDSIVSYQFDWTDYFAWIGDTLDSAELKIVDSTSTTEDVASTMVIEGQTQTAAGVVTFWVSGGTPGVDHYVRCDVLGVNTNPIQNRDHRTVVIPVGEL